MVVRALDDGDPPGAVLLARDGKLELRLAIDDRRPWLLEVLRALAAGGEAPRVADLADRCGAPAQALAQALTQLQERGWVRPAT